tara:strand:+ start:4328 stop:5032 length:705 start_codon:yes stop_codon:yes gene_type:complete
MSWGMIAVTAVSAGVKYYQANKSAEKAKEQAEKAAIEQKKQQRLLDTEKRKFKAMKFENPYENMENVYEDLTVNQQQAQFQAQQGSQQRANVMENLRGAAGASGVAGLAQAMANQGQLQTQQISASIGQQESANQRLRAQGASNIQMKEREGQKLQQQFNIDKQATLLGMQQGASAGADTAAANAEQMALQGEMARDQAMAEGISSTLTTTAKYTDGFSDFSGEYEPPPPKKEG